jgi:BCD family chlorophyll transporter-like MFS transporter
MNLVRSGKSGLAVGAWGAVQASAAGVSIGISGAISDGVSWAASNHLLGEAMTGPAVGYGTVYCLEIILLFATLVAVGPLVRKARDVQPGPSSRFGLAEFPG